MSRILVVALVGTSLTLSACNSEGSTDAAAAASTSELGAPEQSATTKGAGDTTSAAGAGALTGAMDGGSAGKGEQPQGAGGAQDALKGGDKPADTGADR